MRHSSAAVRGIDIGLMVEKMGKINCAEGLCVPAVVGMRPGHPGRVKHGCISKEVKRCVIYSRKSSIQSG